MRRSSKDTSRFLSDCLPDPARKQSFKYPADPSEDPWKNRELFISCLDENNWNPVEWDRAAEELTWERVSCT